MRSSMGEGGRWWQDGRDGGNILLMRVCTSRYNCNVRAYYMDYPKSEYKWMYNTRVWKRGRYAFLQRNPLCEICRNAGRITPAIVVNHRRAHRGSWSLFKDESNWQALCKSCHDSEAQSIDKKGYSNRVGDDGWPADVKHPFHRL